MTYPVKALLTTVVTRIRALRSHVLSFRKERVEPASLAKGLAQYELPDGVYEINQDNIYAYLVVKGERGEYISATGVLEEDELIRLLQDNEDQHTE